MLISDSRDSSWGSVPAEGEERDLLMLFRYGGPVVYALYRVKVPYLSRFNVPPRAVFHPILELPVSLYPMEMCCVELHNKLYFLGGHFDSAKYRQAKLPAYDIYAFDPKDIDVPITGSVGYKNAMWLRTRPCGKLIRPKPFPYAFVALDKIFVIDNLGQLYIKSCFEVFDPKDKQGCTELPDVPVDFIISGHAVVGEKIFLNGDGRGRVGHVICFDAKAKVWIQDFIQDFSDEHMFLGEGKVVGDTMYALAGDYFSTPAAYKLSSEHVQYNLDECAAMNKELPLDDHATDLFDECAFLSPSLEEVHQLVSKNWLKAMIVHMGDGVFCYMRSGKFPHESCHESTGVVLSFFKALTEPSNGTSFDGQFMHSAQLNFPSSGPRGTFGHGVTVSLRLCVSIPKHADDSGLDMEQVVGMTYENNERSIQFVRKNLLEVGFMGAENEWKNLSPGWDEYLTNLHKEGVKIMERLIKGGDRLVREDIGEFRKGVLKALEYATYLRQIWEMDLTEEYAREVFSEGLPALNGQSLVALSL